MAAVVVRNLPDATLRALKRRATLRGRSTEAEIRAILEAVVRPPVGIGTALAAIGRAAGGLTLPPAGRGRRSLVRPAHLA